MSAGPGPLAFVHNWVPEYRRGLFELLARRQAARFLLFGGRWGLDPDGLRGQVANLDAPADVLAERQIYGRLRRGGFRAVVASTNGRVALPSAYLAARRSAIPFILWSTMWRHPRTLSHLATWPGTRWIYSHADAVVTYGPHVSRYVGSLRARGNVFEAPQALDNDAFAAPLPGPALDAVRDRIAGRPVLLFAGRLVEAKGIRVLADAWRAARSGSAGEAMLAVAGEGPLAGELAALDGVLMIGKLPQAELRAWYASARALVLPSIPTRAFIEPWGYVVNEAFLLGRPVIVSDAVGAAAGGLVGDGVNGLVVPAGEPEALAGAIGRLVGDRALAERLGAAGRESVAAYTFDAQAAGFDRALEACGVSLGGSPGAVR